MEEKDKEINDIITIDGCEIGCDISCLESDEPINILHFNPPESIGLHFVDNNSYYYSEDCFGDREVFFNNVIKNNSNLIAIGDKEYKCVDYKQVNDKVGILTFQDIETGEEYVSYI